MPAMSSAEPPLTVLRAMIELNRIASPPGSTFRPPPEPPVVTVLYAIVALTAVKVPALSMPAPSVAELSAMVVLVNDSVSSFSMAPPIEAVLPENVTPSSVAVAVLLALKAWSAGL